MIRTIYPPSQKTTGVSPWMNTTVGPAVALAKVGASADSAEDNEGYHGRKPVEALFFYHFESLA